MSNKLSSRSFFRTSDGAYLFFQDSGAGVPLIMLHGWSLSSRVFEKNIDLLSEKYRVIAPDYRGHGYSSKCLEGHMVSRYAQDIRELLDYLGIHRFFLCGWSLSVTVALDFIRQYGQEELLGLILIDGSCEPFTDAPWNAHALSGYNMEGLIQKFQALLHDPAALRHTACQWFLDQETFSEAIDFFASEMAKTPIWISYAIYCDYIMQNTTEVLSQLHVPVLILVPEKNRLRGEFELSLVSNGHLEIFKARHALFYERSQQFNELLLDFPGHCTVPDHI